MEEQPGPPDSIRVSRLKRLSCCDEADEEDDADDPDDEVDELGNCCDGDPDGRSGGVALSLRAAELIGCIVSWELRMRDEDSGRLTPYSSRSSSVSRCGREQSG